MNLVGLEVDIYEEGMEYPIVRHVFIGRTPEEALGYLRAHMKTDAFLRGCDQRGRWNGVRCRTAELRFVTMTM